MLGHNYGAARPLRSLLPASPVGAAPDDWERLDAYAQACGADVAASDEGFGAFFTAQQALIEGAWMARCTLQYRLCTTVDADTFILRYQAAFLRGYTGYLEEREAEDRSDDDTVAGADFPP